MLVVNLQVTYLQAVAYRQESFQTPISTIPKCPDDLCFDLRSSRACEDHSSKVQENSAVPKHIELHLASRAQVCLCALSTI
jgi:hypothetical protein